MKLIERALTELNNALGAQLSLAELQGRLNITGRQLAAVTTTLMRSNRAMKVDGYLKLIVIAPKPEPSARTAPEKGGSSTALPIVTTDQNRQRTSSISESNTGELGNTVVEKAPQGINLDWGKLFTRILIVGGGALLLYGGWRWLNRKAQAAVFREAAAVPSKPQETAVSATEPKQEEPQPLQLPEAPSAIEYYGKRFFEEQRKWYGSQGA